MSEYVDDFEYSQAMKNARAQVEFLLGRVEPLQTENARFRRALEDIYVIVDGIPPRSQSITGERLLEIVRKALRPSTTTEKTAIPASSQPEAESEDSGK